MLLLFSCNTNLVSVTANGEMGSVTVIASPSVSSLTESACSKPPGYKALEMCFAQGLSLCSMFMNYLNCVRFVCGRSRYPHHYCVPSTISLNIVFGLMMNELAFMLMYLKFLNIYMHDNIII